MGSTDVVETVRYKLKGGGPTFGGVSTMQEMTSVACDAVRVNEEGLLKDTRDENFYRVARLADGKCWMTENLRLKLNANTLPLKGTSADGKTSDLSENATWDPGSGAYTVDGISRNDDNAGVVSWNTGNGQGTYWQWNAATAGQGSSVTNDGENTNQSVCPKGWRLPTGNGGDFITLARAYNTIEKFIGVPGFTLSGWVNSGFLSNVGSYGYYWSSTSNGSADAHNLLFSSSSVNPSYGSYRRYGCSVRCVAR